jgi:hypothetical protein
LPSILPVDFNEKDHRFCLEQAVARNKNKRNQTVSRGWPPLVKHIMGIYAEYAIQEVLGATMDWNTYGKFGDRGQPDGTLPDGRKIIAKSVGSPDIKDIWIPKECLDNCKPEDVIVAFQVVPRLSELVSYEFESLGFLGWASVKDFLLLGKENTKHYNAAESIPGKKLDRDICWILSKNHLHNIKDLMNL